MKGVKSVKCDSSGVTISKIRLAFSSFSIPGNLKHSNELATSRNIAYIKKQVLGGNAKEYSEQVEKVKKYYVKL